MLIAGELAAWYLSPPSPWWAAAPWGVWVVVRVAHRRPATRGLVARLPYVAVLTGVGLVGLHRGAAVLDPPCKLDAPCALDLPRTVEIEGLIATEPVDRSGRQRFDLELRALRDGDRWQTQGGRIRVWARGLGEGWHAGGCLRARVRLRRPRSFNNPGGFDYARYLRRRGVSVTGGIWNGGSIEGCEHRPGRLRELVLASRRRIAVAIDEAVPAGPAGVIRALVIGDRSGLSKSRRTSYARAGVAHLLAISGLHLAVVAGAVFAALRFLAGLSETVLTRGLAPRLAALGTVPATLAYGVLAGARAPTLRATVMISVYLTSVICQRRSSLVRSLALAALIIVMAWPGAAFDLSFWFSFVAVGSIAVGARRFRISWATPSGLQGPASATVALGESDMGRSARASRQPVSRFVIKWVLTSGIASMSAALGTAPLSAYFFNLVSFAGPLANLVAVPLFSAAVVAALSGALLSLVAASWAASPFWIAGVLVQAGETFVGTVAGLPGAATRTVTPTVLELGLAYAALGCALIGPKQRLFLLTTVALLVAGDGLYWARERYARSCLRVSFLDVGQGDAAVVEFPGSGVLVIDAGGFGGSDFDTGEAIVAPFLWSRKIARVDYVAMSHAEADHAGGLPFIVREFRPREFWWNGRPGKGRAFERLQAALSEGGVTARELSRDTPPWSVGPVSIEVLHPPPGYSRSASANDASLVLRLKWGATTVLFTGDVEDRGEEQLAELDPALTRSSVVKVPHHGSRTSSGVRFVEAVDPNVAVFSVGAGNRHGLPHLQVRARYEARRVCMRRTDRHGAIVLRGTAAGYVVDPPCGD